jgi:transposase InsO family protein
MYARTTCFDRVPIQAVTRDAVVFRHFQMDVFGPIIPNEKLKHNFALIVICSASRYPFTYPLTKVNSKNVCDALVKIFEITGLASEMVLTSDNATYFRSSLMCEFLKRLGVTPRFSIPYHPEGHSLAERGIQTIQSLIAKLASEHRNNWTAYLGVALWAIREVPNATTGLPPHLLVFGQLRAGPLSIFRGSWMGDCEIKNDSDISTEKYLIELREKLEAANEYASQHSKAEQNQFVRTYNRRTRDESFSVGEQCLILQKDSTSSALFAQWKGPAEIVEVKSPYSYVVSYNGSHYHLHANKLRKFHTQIETVECNSTMYATTEIVDEQAGNCSCPVIYEKDFEFCDISVIETPAFVKADALTSQRIKPETVSHLNTAEVKELFELLDKFSDVFREVPGLCPLVEHTIAITDDFKPKRLRAYKVPENYRAEVSHQIQELLRLGFIEPSNSPQVSLLVCVLKPKDSNGKQALRTVIDYRYVNKFTLQSVSVMEDICDILQKVGNAKYISKFDANSGYHQCLVRKEDRWLTAFVCDDGVFQYCRAPFGLKGSGNTFSQAVRKVIEQIKEYTIYKVVC